MNKKAVAQIPVAIYWIAAIVVGILFANQAGLFNIFPPPGTETSPPTLLNNYYWGETPGEAVQNYQFDCALNPLTLRTDSLTTPTWIVRRRAGTLVGFILSTSNGGVVTDPSSIGTLIPNTNFYENGNNIYLFKGDRVENVPDGKRICLRPGYGCINDPDKTVVCSDCSSCGASTTDCGPNTIPITVHDYWAFNLNDAGVITQYKSSLIKCGGNCNSAYEYWDDGATGTNPYIWGIPKFACRNNNIVSQYCRQKDSGNDYSLLQTCAPNQPCKFYTPTETAGLAGEIANKPAVKCGQDPQKWIPSQQLCQGENFYWETNSAGDKIGNGQLGETLGKKCPTETGGKCFQDTGSTAHCTECNTTSTRINPGDNKYCQGCTGSGTWFNKEICPGLSTCQYISKNNYQCLSGITDGQLACGGQSYSGLSTDTKQRYRFNGATQTWVTNGATCTLACDTSSPDKCTSNCDWIRYTGVGSCSIGLGLLTYCDVSNPDTGKYQRNDATYPRKYCRWGSCNTDTSGCYIPYVLNRDYCVSNIIRTAITDTSTDADLVAGGIILVPKTICSLGCTAKLTSEGEPVGGDQCNLATGCLRVGQKICLDDYEIGICSATGDINPERSCLVDNNKYCSMPDPNGDADCYSQPTECYKNKGCRMPDNTIWACDGITGEGYWTGTTYIDDCNGNGCTETKNGEPQCNEDALCSGKGYLTSSFYSCDSSSSISYFCKTTPGNDFDNIQLLVDTANTLACSNGCTDTSVEASRCLPYCTKIFCEGDSVRDCINGQPAATQKWSCNNLGCTDGKCNDDPVCLASSLIGKVGFMCSNSIETECKKDPINNQIIKTTKPCTIAGCDAITGKCAQECSGNSICSGDPGKIYQCISNEKTETVLNDCMGKGCTVISGVPTCNNDCNGPTDTPLACLNPTNQIVSTCTEINCKSITCMRNITTNQFYNFTKSCGSSGCSQKKCIGNIEYANSYDCSVTNPNQIWKTDENGVMVTFHKNCNPPDTQPVNGLNPYCKPGNENCYFCEPPATYCIQSSTTKSGTQFSCENSITGAVSGTTTCEAGCGKKTNGEPYCDHSFSVLPDITNFPLTAGATTNNTGNINMQIKLLGETSRLPIAGATITATLSGVGVTAPSQQRYTLSDGSLSNPIQFNGYQKGQYNITINVQGYSIDYNKVIPVIITDSFTVNKFERDVLYLIPGVPPSIQIKVQSTSGATPDILVVSSWANLTSRPTVEQSDDHPELWTVKFSTEISPGFYTIGFKPFQSGVSEQDIIERPLTFEVSQPTLSATLNNPESTTPGTKEYRLQIAGQRYSQGVLTTGDMAPDLTPKATITYNNVSSSITLLDQGGGSFLMNYNFKDTGTYVINIKASKSGYVDATLSKIMQISGSGTELPPATDGSGSGGGTSASGGGILSGITGGLIGGGSSITTYIIIGIGLVIIYLLFTRRKR